MSSATTNTELDDTTVDGGFTMRPTEGRAQLKLYKGELLPSGNISSAITKFFKKRNNPSGCNWTLLSDDLKDLYFEEFKKKYSWDPSLDEIVHTKWLAKARRLYRYLIHGVKVKKYDLEGQPSWIPDDAWQGWLEYWERENVKIKAEKARLCRLSEPDGPGSGYSRHRGGSKCALEYAMEISQEKGITEEEAAPDVFEIFHKSKNGEYTNNKARHIATKMEEKLSQSVSGTSDDPPISRSKAFIEASGGLDYRNRLFGAGYIANDLKNVKAGRSSSCVNQEVIKEQITELQLQLETERQERKKMEEAQDAQQELMNQLVSRLHAQQEVLNALRSRTMNGSTHTPPSS